MKGLLYLLTVITHIAKAFLVMRDHQRRLDEQELREELMAQKARENEARIAQAQNRVIVTDLQIEMQKLKIMELERKLGVNAPDWTPENYDH